MDKNLLMAVSLSIAVYALWFGFIEKKFAPIPAPAVHGAAAPPSADGALTPAAAPASAPAPGAAASPAEKLKADGAVLAESFPAELAGGRALIRPEGAAIVSLKQQEPLGVVELIADPEPGFLSAFPAMKFAPVSGAARPTFEAKTPVFKVVKEFLPGTDDALPRLRISVTNQTKSPQTTGAWALSLGPGLGTIASEEKENKKNLRALGLLKSEGGGLKDKVETFKPGATLTNNYLWVGVDNRYFLAAVAPKPDEFTTVGTLPLQVDLYAKGETLAAGATRVWEIPYYFGPKSQTVLSRYGLGLERAINFGFFAQLGRFILKVLFKLHGYTGNWGWSIIILTILLQTIMFPLTYKSLKATLAMKRLQPEIAKLQQRYGKDPTRLNTEMMELYKKEGANPLGGCLPMLLQMPIFLALFNALRNAWELHGAPWMFWIKDLSVKDPYYVLPLIMGGLMFAQNKLNPPSADPAQQQMMQFMPVIFTVMFMNFPSGLVLYWLTNSLVTTTQQLVLKGHFENAKRR